MNCGVPGTSSHHHAQALCVLGVPKQSLESEQSDATEELENLGFSSAEKQVQK